MRFQIAVTPLGWGDVCGRAGGPRGSQKEKRGVQVVKKVGFGAGEQGGQGSSLSHLKNLRTWTLDRTPLSLRVLTWEGGMRVVPAAPRCCWDSVRC